MVIPNSVGREGNPQPHISSIKGQDSIDRMLHMGLDVLGEYQPRLGGIHSLPGDVAIEPQDIFNAAAIVLRVQRSLYRRRRTNGRLAGGRALAGFQQEHRYLVLFEGAERGSPLKRKIIKKEMITELFPGAQPISSI